MTDTVTPITCCGCPQCLDAGPPPMGAPHEAAGAPQVTTVATPTAAPRTAAWPLLPSTVLVPIGPNPLDAGPTDEELGHDPLRLPR